MQATEVQFALLENSVSLEPRLLLIDQSELIQQVQDLQLKPTVTNVLQDSIETH